MKDVNNKPTLVRGIERAMEILKCFSYEETELTLAEISEQSNLPRSTVHRILSTLKHGYFIEQDQEGGKYRLSFEIMRLGAIASASIDLRHTADTEMKWLSEKTQQTSNLYVIQGYHRLCIAQMQGPQYVRRYSYLGALLPLYAGASGKVLLAHKSNEWLEDFFENIELERMTENTIVDKNILIEELQDIYKQGYACSVMERDPISFSLSAPIFDCFGNVIAGLTVSGPSVMLNKGNKEEYISLLLEATKRISQKLGY